MTQEKTTNYIGPFITMVFLFFIIGFLTTANTQFQAPLQETFFKNVGSLRNTLSTLITFSWFLAYPIAGPLGTRWVNKYAYKGTLVRGLIVMTLGLALFLVSSSVTSHFPDKVMMGFGIFLLGSFITGASASILQVVINPYLCACEVKGTQSIQRLAIGGSANSVGTTIAPYFVSGIVFGHAAMSDVEISGLLVPYLCLVAIMIIITIILFRTPLPDIENTRNEGNEKLEKSVWSFRHLTLGVIAIFFYVGVEVCVGANITMNAIEMNIDNFMLLSTIYWGLMLVGRLIGSSLNKVSPKVQLCFTTIAATVLISLAVIFNNVWLLSAVGLFHSIMWGAIFTLATKDLGKYTSAASGVFMIGVVGGAILPLIQGFLSDTLGGWRLSWLIVLLGELFMLYYALLGSKVQNTSKK